MDQSPNLSTQEEYSEAKIFCTNLLENSLSYIIFTSKSIISLIHNVNGVNNRMQFTNQKCLVKTERQVQ